MQKRESEKAYDKFFVLIWEGKVSSAFQFFLATLSVARNLLKRKNVDQKYIMLNKGKFLKVKQSSKLPQQKWKERNQSW